jgi:AraC-like DNA-binding protein
MVKLYREISSIGKSNSDSLFKVAIREKTTAVPDCCFLDRADLYTWPLNYQKFANGYHIHYVTDGKGHYEDNTGKYFVGTGTLMIIKPGVPCKFFPSPETGWVENYLMFNWPLAEFIIDNAFPSQNKPVFDIGLKDDILDAFHKIFELASQNNNQIQQYITGMILKLLGVVLTSEEQHNGSLERLENTIHQTCFFVKRNVDKNIDFKKIAFENNLGYEHFRKIFKQIIGIPPGQYHLQLKIDAARKLLLSTNKSVKEISYDLGFESVYYFCRLFKKKMGITPSQAREGLVLA